MPYCAISALAVLEPPGFAPQQSDWIKNAVKCCCWSYQNKSESKMMKTEGIRITIVSLVALVINNCYNRKNIKRLCAYCEVFRSSLQIGLLWGADECLNSSNAKPEWIYVAEAARQKVWETTRSSTNLQQTTVKKNRRKFLHIMSKSICPFYVARCKTPANVSVLIKSMEQ